MGEYTKIVTANATNSLRTTIPKGIARQMNLKAGSQLEWQIMVGGDGRLAIEVKPR